MNALKRFEKWILAGCAPPKSEQLHKVNVCCGSQDVHYTEVSLYIKVDPINHR